jgi:hypothetical protein
MYYKPPTPEELDRLKNRLGKSSSEMAKLFGLSSGRAWRRYASDVDGNHRDMGMHMLFFAMARLTLKQKDIETVLEAMREAGAIIDLTTDSDSPEQGGEQP